MAGPTSPAKSGSAEAGSAHFWPRASALAVVLLSSALIAVGCGSSGHSGHGTTSATTHTFATSTVSGHALKSLPKAPAPPAGTTTVDRCFLRTTFDNVQRFWRQEFRGAGLTYKPARLVIFSSKVDSGCGVQENVGPFYCPANHGIYLDVGFFEALARHADLGGFAQAYVIGHEFGHHIQQLLGIHGRVGAANQANPASQKALPCESSCRPTA